jgi:hypothetical protein
MAGVRLHHPTLRGGIYLVKHFRRYRYPFACPTCGTVHIQKTYHLNLDNGGFTIVSPEVLARLKEVGLAGLEIMNEVEKPPAITLTIPGTIYDRFRVFETTSRGEKNG